MYHRELQYQPSKETLKTYIQRAIVEIDLKRDNEVLVKEECSLRRKNKLLSFLFGV